MGSGNQSGGYGGGNNNQLPPGLSGTTGFGGGGGGGGGGYQGNGFQRPQPYYGGQMGMNPWLDDSFNRAADSVEGRMRGSTAFQGLSNSGVQEQYNRNLNDLATGVYGGAYEQDANRRLQSGMAISQMQQQGRDNDLNRMMTAAQAMPQFLAGSTQYGLGIGDIYRDFDQSNINDAIRAFEEQRMYPYQQVDVLGRAIGASMGNGGTVTTTSPGYYQPSSTAGMLGAGLAGYGLLQSLMPGEG